MKLEKLSGILQESTIKHIEKLITKLKILNQELPIIVEGSNDSEALKKIGFSGKIITYNIGVSTAEFVENISQNYKKVILLMDFNRKGLELLKYLKNFFEANNVITITEFYHQLRFYLKKNISSIEDLSNLSNFR